MTALKDDKRPPRNGWAPGGYYCSCKTCNIQFAGDKRATLCADCAYKLPWPPAPIPELNDKLALVIYFETEQDREEFIQAFHEVKPNCRTVKLDMPSR